MTKENEEERSNSNFDEREWKDFRANLKGKHEYSPETEADWKRAIAIFSNRLDDYFLKPIDFLIKKYEGGTENTTRTKNIGEGFSIVTLQCALIETLAAFKNGLIHNLHPKFDYEYNDSKKLFIEFLQSIERKERVKDFKDYKDAEDFYTEVRCGLIHETRTKSSWSIHANVEIFKKKNPDRNDIADDNIIVKNGQKGRILFRNQLQDALNSYFVAYKKNLAKPEAEFDDLRKFLARKLDHLFDIERDETFDWWKHQCVCKYCNQVKND